MTLSRSFLGKNKLSRFFPLLFYIVTLSTLAHAAPGDPSTTTSASGATRDSTSKGDATRDFYKVLDAVLGDFEYDLKKGTIPGLKNLSIRNIATSENVPPSFKTHLDLLITEKILKNSQTKVIECLSCKSRRTSLDGENVIVTSPESNFNEVAKIAKMSNINHFMDIAFSFQPTVIILSMYIIDPESGNIIWSKSYNSEAPHHRQIEETRKEVEYTPAPQGRVILYYLFEPNLPVNTGCLALGYRLVERYNNLKKEVGFEVNYLVDTSTLINKANTSSQNLYSAFNLNLTLLFIHAWNFFGEEEDYDKVRLSFLLGAGGTFANGFTSGLVRSQIESRLARRWGVSLSVGYRPPASAVFSTQPTAAVTGLEYGLGLNYLF